MARKIIWSVRAQEDRKNIFSYWNNRNKSSNYSRKLNELFLNHIELLALFPEIGKSTNSENTRIKIVGYYLLIYEFSNEYIYILSIWDSRQNPNKLNDLF